MRSSWTTPHSIAMLLAVIALAAGIAAWLGGEPDVGSAIWAAGVVPALIVLVVEIGRELLRGEPGVDIIAGLAMSGTLVLGENLAGLVIALMFTGGNVLEEFAQSRAGRELTALLACRPRIAHREVGDTMKDLSVEAVRTGDRLVVKCGEVLLVDGTLLDAAALIDEAALTGEALPVEFKQGAGLRSGTVSAGGPLRLRADASAAESTYADVVRLVEAAQQQKAPFVRLADRWSLVYLALTLAVAGIAYLASGDPVRALAVLVVAIPCPLILAVPVAIVTGISVAARHGALVKGGGALETLARARTVMFDKTGTLTTGTARVVAVQAHGDAAAEELLRLVASLEQVSQHVLAGSITAAARERSLTLLLPEDVSEALGAGIEGSVAGRRLRLGGLGWVWPTNPPAWAEALTRRARLDGHSSVFLAVDGRLVGALLLADEIRPETPRALRALHRTGIARVVMLSGDRQDVTETVAAALGVDSVLADRSPQDKVDAVRAERADGVTVMVGDGLNDAPALAAADVGVAMGARGAGAASEAADVVLLVDRLDVLAVAIRVSRRARTIALQSVLAGIGLSTMGMLVAAAGYLPPLAGAVTQETIDVAVILNALRALADGGTRRATLPATQVRLLHAEHGNLAGVLDRMRALADRLGIDDHSSSLQQELVDLVQDAQTVLAHERADEAELLPQLAQLMGGEDPMAAMSRTHREIAHLGRHFARLVADLREDGPYPEEITELWRTLYALEAILRLHFAQENELYDSVAGEVLRRLPAQA